MISNLNNLYVVRYRDLSRVDFGGKERIKNSIIGYTATATLVKCFVGFSNGKKPSDYFTYDDMAEYDAKENSLNDESIRSIYDIYCRRFPGFVKVNKIDQKAIDEIKELVNRTIDYMNDKQISFFDNDVFVAGNDVYTLSISIEGPTPSKLSENTALSVQKCNGIFHINNWYIYNPRLNGEWSCCLDDVLDKRKMEEIKRAAKATVIPSCSLIDVEKALETYKTEIEQFEFDDLFEQALVLDENLTKQKAFEIVERIRNKTEVSFKDAFFAFIDDLELGKKHSNNDVLFDGVLYTSKRDAYRELFPDLTLDEVQSSIAYRMTKANLTWDEAVRSLRDDPPGKRSDQVVYNGKRYKSKKSLLKVLFPKRRYESVYSSIMQIMQKDNISFEDAIKKYKEKGKPNNLKKEIKYDGVVYKSLRSACKTLGLKPERVSYLAKEKFNNDYVKAIDHSITEKAIEQ